MTMNEYFRQIERSLPCGAGQRRKIMQLIRSRVEEYRT